MKLSKNLSLAEVTKSITAKRLNIDNTPDDWVQGNLKAVAEHVFQPLRDAFKCPIFVSSGYRSADLNVAIGAQFVVSMWREEHSTLMQTYTESVRTLRSSSIYSTISRLISSFGSLVMKTILIGFTFLMFTMALIVVAASRLVAMMKERLTTK